MHSSELWKVVGGSSRLTWVVVEVLQDTDWTEQTTVMVSWHLVESRKTEGGVVPQTGGSELVSKPPECSYLVTSGELESGA